MFLMLSLSTIRIKSWAGACNPGETGRVDAPPIPLRSIGCLAVGLSFAESFYR